MNTPKGSPHGTNGKNARWAGIFYIIATVAPISTIFFVGFLGGQVAGGGPIPDYLVNISSNEAQGTGLIRWDLGGARTLGSILAV